MRYLAIAALPNETGGTLVGHYSDDLREAHIEQVLGASCNSKSGFSWFYDPPDKVDGQLATIYSESNGATYYLGEWHTHPGNSPTPSSIDLVVLRRLARSEEVATNTPILIILGNDFVSTLPIVCLITAQSSKPFYGKYETLS